MTVAPRVALFADCFLETNGVAHTCRQLAGWAGRNGRPLLVVHSGPKQAEIVEGSVARWQYRRSPIRLRLDADLSFDLALLRLRARLRERLAAFRPDVIHVTGPGDAGILGLILAYEFRVPLFASWHTNLHQFAARRLAQKLAWLPRPFRAELVEACERTVLNLTLWYYGESAAVAAPNPELVRMIGERTERPVFLMKRGVDTELFRPRECGSGEEVVLGYVGRLNAEKGVRMLADVERALQRAGIADYRFLVVGQGFDQPWLRENLRKVEFTGVLRGEALAGAYRKMDLLLFPSRSDTFGNVVLESMASGVPPVVFWEGGPRYLMQPGISGMAASRESEFVEAALRLVRERDLREQLGSQAHAAAQAYPWEDIFVNLYSGYKSLCCSSSATGLFPVSARKLSSVN